MGKDQGLTRSLWRHLEDNCRPRVVQSAHVKRPEFMNLESGPGAAGGCKEGTWGVAANGCAVSWRAREPRILGPGQRRWPHSSVGVREAAEAHPLQW